VVIVGNSYRIAVIGGDGVGPEVVHEGLRVLDAAADRFGFAIELTDYPFGTDHWLRTKEIFPESATAEVQAHDAILLGAIGDPRAPVGLIERGVIGHLRWDLDLFVNLRPIRLYHERFCPLKDKTPADVDMVIVRENTEDAYVQRPLFENQGTADEVASQSMRYTRRGTERIIRYAFEMAMMRPRKELLLIDKANAVRAQDLYTRVFAEVGEEYPDVKTDHAYIDAACMWMIKNPEWFDVAVTTNLFGDIITDVGAMIQGGMGVAASANVHPGKLGLFEPIHGSFPKATGQNTANPLATIAAVAMMLDYLGEQHAGRAIDDAIAALLSTGTIKSLKAGATPTDALGTMVIEQLLAD
jgi:3-isopropylmalate dehydrogenase